MSGGPIRKLAVLAAIAAIVSAVVRALRGDPAPQFANHPTVRGGPDPTPTAPPAAASAAAASVAAAPPTQAAPASPAADTAWVLPDDGACPEGYPVKAKLKSGIFHQPGDLAYERTNPDRCYPTAESAVADGLRPPKR